jgi:STE24 endopeptidase
MFESFPSMPYPIIPVMNIYLLIIFLSYLCITCFGYWLKMLNLAHLKKYGADVPPEFKDSIDAALLKKTRDYTVENSRFSFINSIFDNVVLLVFLFGGLLNVYSSWVASLGWNSIISGLAFFLFLYYAENVVSIPFSLYSTFKIENKFGFNTLTPRLWITDFIKSLLLSTLLIGIIVSVGLWLMGASPGLWWLWVWGFFLVFSLFVMYIAPYVIEPLFNKFTPVGDSALEEKIKEVAQKAGIKVGRIFRMDASKRSRHTNAYFTGIGKVKRIVLYDTLMELMETDEIVAVLAHEIGHWKKRHILKRIIVSEVIAFVSLYIAFLMLRSDMLLNIFSIEADSLFANIVILGFIGSIIAFPFSPLSNYFTRRHEMQADRFACKLSGDPGSMAGALIKLSKDNLSNLHPHPWYAAFYYSHPPVVQRIREIRACKT